MFLRSLGERIVVELDSVDCEILAKACRQSVGTCEAETYVHEALTCFFASASAISQMHGWSNEPDDTQEKLDALCQRVEGAEG